MHMSHSASCWAHQRTNSLSKYVGRWRSRLREVRKAPSHFSVTSHITAQGTPCAGCGRSREGLELWEREGGVP